MKIVVQVIVVMAFVRQHRVIQQHILLPIQQQHPQIQQQQQHPRTQQQQQHPHIQHRVNQTVIIV